MAWEDIFTCTHVRVREGAVKPPLAKLYKGPHLVIDRSSKYFNVITDHSLKKVSIDRLKSAYVLPEANYEDNGQLEEDLSTFILEREHDDEVVETETTGRKINLPNRFKDYINAIVGHK